jgi:hypothetical protein
MLRLYQNPTLHMSHKHGNLKKHDTVILDKQWSIQGHVR